MKAIRKVRTYKAVDKVYKKSARRAKKEKTTLAKQIETWLSWYAEGDNIIIQQTKLNLCGGH